MYPNNFYFNYSFCLLAGKRHDKINRIEANLKELKDKVEVISNKLERLIIADEILKRRGGKNKK